MPDRCGRYGRWGGSSLGCLESGPPPHPRPLSWRGGGPCFLEKVEPRQVWGTLMLGLGAEGAPSGSRHLLPYFHVDLWPRRRRLSRSPESPDPPVSGTRSPTASPPEALQKLPQRGVSCQLPAEGVGVCRARGHAGGDSTFQVSLPGGAPGGESLAGWGRRTVWEGLGPPAARGPCCALGDAGGREGEAANRDQAAPGRPTGDTRVTGEGAPLGREGRGSWLLGNGGGGVAAGINCSENACTGSARPLPVPQFSPPHACCKHKVWPPS